MRAIALVAVLALAACAPSGPAALDTRNDACSWCRMAVSDRRFAAQLVAPGEDPRFFDDVGCLASYLRSKRDLASGSRAYVSDHRTQQWVAAEAAVYARVPSLETPMGSHLVAHADEGSRRQDLKEAGGPLLSWAEVSGPERSGP